MIPAFVTNLERIEWPKRLCEQLAKTPGIIPVIIDTGSTSREVLSWYRNCDFLVWTCTGRPHSRAAWESGAVDRLARDYYIVTDGDLDIGAIPSDWLEKLKHGLKRYPQIIKAALSLEVNGITDPAIYKKVWEIEERHWKKHLPDGFIDCHTDTTLALYHQSRPWRDGDHFYTSVRTDRPYTAIHLPWVSRSKDCERYEKAVLDGTTFWTQKFRDGHLPVVKAGDLCDTGDAKQIKNKI